jgi:ATP-binding cassette, subfamily B, bacterial
MNRPVFREHAIRCYSEVRTENVLPRLGSPLVQFTQRIVTALTSRRRRAPVIIQMSTVECAAACLAMVLGHHGRRTGVAECRERIGIGRDGASARDISRAAQTYGLRVRSYSLEPEALQDVALPAIAHWKFNHFVVIERWSADRIDIIDPALGRRSLSAKEFGEAFTGVVLVLEPGIAFETGGTKRPGVAGYYRELLKGSGNIRILVQILAASLVLQAFGMIAPLFTKVLVDTILPRQMHGMMSVIAIGIVLLVAGQMLTSYLRSALLLYLQARLDSQIMLGFFEHVLSLPYPFFQQRTTGDLLMRLGSNVAIRETLTNQVVSAVLDGGFVLVYLAALFALQPFFAAAALAIGTIQVGVMLATRRALHEATERDLAAAAESQAYLVEAVGGIATLKASGVEDRALEHWSSLFFRHLESSLRKGRLSSIVGTVLVSLRIFAALFLLWLAALQVLEGRMTLGMMLAVNAMAAMFLAPLGSLVAVAQQLHLVRAHLDRIADVLAAEPEQFRGSAVPTLLLKGGIELRNVDFRYHAGGPLVLRNISMIIQPGQKVALVGRTGSGKSTLARLMLGFYRPGAGEILYDGQPALHSDLRALRRQIGVVLQEPFLFSGPVRQNIAFRDPELSLESVMAAARTALIHDDLENLPMRYETMLAEGGTNLSGGQRQRLAIARALVHNPRILILDEATSHLDVVTESRLERNLAQLGYTRIVIAHRLSTIRDADQIVVMDEGAIVEQGTHDELLRCNGHYAAMVASQEALS